MKPKELSDFEVVRAAEKLLYSTSLRSKLPPKYTLQDLATAELALQAVASKFFSKYGSRLKSLSPPVFRELEHWTLLSPF